MLDFVFLVAFVALPVLTWLVTRSLTWTAVGLVFGFGVAGNLVQSSIAFGAAWQVRGLQVASVAVMAVVLVIGAVWGRGRTGGSLRRQLLVIGLPAVVLGGFLILMRLLAPGAPGPLTAIGYFINHSRAEDNAKWLHLTSQLAEGRDIAFNGYAGGPLLLLMAVMAALISVLSIVLVGGVNEVAVAANTVLGVQFLLIALVPLAFAPLAERGVWFAGVRARVASPFVWSGMLVLFLASSVITSFGHLSLQFVLIVLVLWALVFVTAWPGQARLLMSLAVATTASVWLPFNVLGLLILVGALIWIVRQRRWRWLAAWAVTVVATFDALFSSTLYLLGIDLGSDAGGGGTASESGGAVATGGGVDALPEQVKMAAALFTSPGGVEQAGPILGILAVTVLLFAAWRMIGRVDTRGWAAVAPFTPAVLLGAYVVAIQVADAITTGGAPHYGGHKLAFALVIMVLASMAPIALAGLSDRPEVVNVLQWLAIGGVVALLTIDTILPRAISALSPTLWPKVNSSSPQYWSAAEVKNTANQPISSSPIACFFAPPQTGEPTALPNGQESYACTRLLIGLTGLEGETGVMQSWLQTDWMSNQQLWSSFYSGLVDTSGGFANRPVILRTREGGIAGMSTLGSLLERYRPLETGN